MRETLLEISINKLKANININYIINFPLVSWLRILIKIYIKKCCFDFNTYVKLLALKVALNIFIYKSEKINKRKKF